MSNAGAQDSVDVVVVGSGAGGARLQRGLHKRGFRWSCWKPARHLRRSRIFPMS